MSGGGSPSAASFARAVERICSELRDRPVVLSPRDFRLICDWHARGIPLAIVRETLEAAQERERKRGRGGLSRLSYVAPAVEEAWRVVIEGRLNSSATEPGETGIEEPGTVPCWRLRRDAEPPGSPLAELLGELQQLLEQGAVPQELDDRLDQRLAETVPSSLLRQVEAQLERELREFRTRISASELEATRRKAIPERLRRLLDLPRLPETREPG